MTRRRQFTVFNITVAATLMIASSASAQFNFGGGSIQFGGSNRGVPNFNVGRQFQNVQPNWQRADRPITDMRYRGPVNTVQPEDVVLGALGLAIDAQAIVGDHGPDRTSPICDQPICPQPGPLPGPAPIDPIVEPVVNPAPVNPALELTYEAQDAFIQQNYVLATETMNRVLELSPESSAAYQFRALTHFALGNYDLAAADLYDTLLRGPLWTWETVYPLYGNRETYTGHYAAVARSAKEDPASMSRHFVLAYHHLMLGHLEHGERELQKVLTIQPNEPVMQQLLGVVQTLRTQGNVATR